jgi:proteic killer suppression protein
MIKSFSDKNTEELFKLRKATKGFPYDILERALDKLVILDAANSIDDLRIVPGNKYEKLKGKRNKESSIRINEQWRIVFEWKDGNSHNIKIEDYH